MPELPEVETIKMQMEKELIGKTIVDIWVGKEKMCQGDQKAVIGQKILAIKRRAKILIWELSNGQSLLFHLKLTGQLIFIDPERSRRISGPSTKYTRIIFHFSDGTHLNFNDMRQFGWIKLDQLDQFVKLGPEPFSAEFTPEYLKKILSNWGRPIKLLLLDQEKIAGIGNIYANEALFCAGIAPHHRGRDLIRDHPEKTTKLYGCVKKVLSDGLKYGGSSGADEQYVNLYGQKGQMQEHFKVYQRAGQPCPNNCGKNIKRMTIGGRGTFFCPRCQR